MQAIASFLKQQAHTAETFRQAQPFPHLVIDNFFSGEFVARLLVEFPPLERGSAPNEAGELGGKSTIEQIVIWDRALLHWIS